MAFSRLGHLGLGFNLQWTGAAAAPTLSALTLSASSIAENASAGTAVGAIQGVTAGSTRSLIDDADGRFAISGGNLVTGSTALDYETATSHDITIRETLPGATNTPRDTTLTIMVIDKDEVPDPFSFTDITDADLSTQYTSDAITVAGLGSGVSTPVSISGGTYSKNGGGFTSSAGSVVNGDTVAVRLTSSASNSTAVSAVLTIGGISDTYSVQTVAADTGLTSPVKALFIGDSTAVGVGAGSGGTTDVNGSRPYSFPIQAAARLASRGYKVATETMTTDNNNGYSAAVWNGYRPEVVLTGSLGTASDSPQIGGVHLNIGAGGNSLAYTTTAEVDRLDLLLHRRSDFGVLGVSVDGGAVQNFSLANATEDLTWQAITGLTLGVHTFTFTRVSGAVRFPVLIDAYNSAENAFHIYNAGARNWTTTDWVVADHPNSPLSAIAYIVPDVVVIDLGINDWRQSGTTIATFKANMQTIIDACLAANPDCKVILSLPHDIQSYVTTTDAWSTAAARAAYEDLASTNSLPLVDGPHEIALAGLSGGVDPATFAAVNAAGYMHDSLHSLAPPYQARGYAMGDAVLTALGLS